MLYPVPGKFPLIPQYEDKTYNLTNAECLRFTKGDFYKIEVGESRVGITYINKYDIPRLSYAPKDTDTAKMFRVILDKVK